MKNATLKNSRLVKIWAVIGSNLAIVRKMLIGSVKEMDSLVATLISLPWESALISLWNLINAPQLWGMTTSTAITMTILKILDKPRTIWLRPEVMELDVSNPM